VPEGGGIALMCSDVPPVFAVAFATNDLEFVMRARLNRVVAVAIAVAGMIHSIRSHARDDESAEEASARNQKI